MNLRRTKFLLILLIIFLLFFGLNKLGVEKIRNTVWLISSPLQKVFWDAGERVSFSFGALFEAEKLKRENRELKKINLKLQHQIITLKQIATENKALRKALNLELEKEFTLSLATPVSTASEGDFILINLGKKDGISQGRPVITAEKILLGKIEKVFDDFSQVALISNPKITFDIEVLAENEKFLGLAKGKGDLKVQFQFVPKESQIKEGDILMTSRLAGNFPQGLLVGEIKTIKKSDVDPFLEGEIKPYFRELDFGILFVIKEF